MKLTSYTLPMVIVTLALVSYGFSEDAKVKTEGNSASAKLRWQIRIGKEGSELWLSKKSGESSVKLADVAEPEVLKVVFSPGDKWLIVEDGGGGLGAHVTVFKAAKSEGTSYEKQQVDLNAKAKALAATSPAGKNVDTSVFEHLYVHCLGWKGKKVALSFSGTGVANGKEQAIKDFKCSYFPDSGEVQTDSP